MLDAVGQLMMSLMCAWTKFVCDGNTLIVNVCLGIIIISLVAWMVILRQCMLCDRQWWHSMPRHLGTHKQRLRVGYFFAGLLMFYFVPHFYLAPDQAENFQAFLETTYRPAIAAWDPASGPLAKLKPHVFYINLASNKDRRARMESALRARGLSGVRVPAVPVASLVTQDDGVIVKAGEQAGLIAAPVENNAVACALLAHLLAARAVYESGVEWALVLEDDASLDLEALWAHSGSGLAEALGSLPQDRWQLLHLFTLQLEPCTARAFRARLDRGEHALSFNGELRGCSNCLWGAVAYALHRRGAQNLLERFWPEALVPGVANPHIDLRTFSGIVSEHLLRELPELYHSTQVLIGHGEWGGAQLSSNIHNDHVSLFERHDERTARFFYDPARTPGPMTYTEAITYYPMHVWLFEIGHPLLIFAAMIVVRACIRDACVRVKQTTRKQIV
jgi:GR25 family glycosyltransferase involved in LPS biosynthesis